MSSKDSSISFKIDKPSLSDFVLKTSHSPVFPIFHLRIVPVEEAGDSELELKVNKKIFNLLKDLFFIDKFTLYLPLNEGSLGIWQPDMAIGLEILTRLGILRNINEWISDSRIALVNILDNQKVESKLSNDTAFKNSEEILNAMSILPDISSNKLLSIVVKDVISAKHLDPQTIIYRLAMAIYHTRNATGESISKMIDNPLDLYLRLLESDYYTKNSEPFKQIDKLPVDLRGLVTKVIAVFAIAAYFYHKEIREL
ncbi:hypothetical protein [Candidatus Nitrosocosmicus sp. SS]|uniref:hypothetical protein n=1 Tax=Candidatus Nitrosocosmicus agrestis TaxID=2563600 RepID=UPI00122E0602|nr:hypothetical protein [Candidatus Nitrosocosmicus sp. SS]KAA2283740.1 hypothetical protein F1Z66_00160 [Candidatus Nitrosocosmicus sp. SS]KAF0870116.1 hypothetical protein E5N71_00885 [Candidatus Nitrosocosmicus sp. SS]